MDPSSEEIKKWWHAESYTHSLHNSLADCYAFTTLDVYVVTVIHLQKDFNQYNFFPYSTRTPPPHHAPISKLPFWAAKKFNSELETVKDLGYISDS